MPPILSLTQLTKLVARNLDQGTLSGELRDLAAEAVAAPTAASALLDLILKQAARRTPDGSLVVAGIMLLGHALEELRYRTDQNSAEALATVAALRSQIKVATDNGRLPGGLLQLVLRQFVVAKLDPGPDLQALMAAQTAATVNDHSHGLDEAAVAAEFAALARQFGDDVFAMQAELAETVATLPAAERAMVVVSLLDSPEAILREAAIGWLLDPEAPVRQVVTTGLAAAAAAGAVSGTQLRRLILLRNWLPAAEREALDAVIRTCRRNDIACAPQPAAQVKTIMASGHDGAGAQSLFVVVKAGRRHAVVSILVKQGIGVREAWVQRDLTKADSDDFLDQVTEQIELYPVTLDYVGTVLGHFLAVGAASGTLPPFGLLDAVEALGLAAVNPAALPLDDLLNRLLAGQPPERSAPAAVARAVTDSGAWPMRYAFMSSWFEADDAVNTLLAGKRLSAARRTELVLTGLLPARRRNWAEALAWSAFLLRDQGGIDWIDMALVARELLAGRSPAEIPLMVAIAAGTVAAWRAPRR